ncbi:hypothetical protein [uncultured Desulfobacter sp.]|uniref:hypothetical protein n=1 Tax=uncultured Desulfobacter sp. TaxID=240139 RepID=UPI0029C754EE|nr:hypothetical protein [uncultured Desulfobacter sp.]
MTDHNSIFAILKQQEKILSSQTEQLSNIEKSLVTMAVQEKEISHLNNQIDALWKKYDQAFGPEGLIARLQAYAANCPKEHVKANLARQWVAIGSIIALMAAIKLWG